MGVIVGTMVETTVGVRVGPPVKEQVVGLVGLGVEGMGWLGISEGQLVQAVDFQGVLQVGLCSA